MSYWVVALIAIGGVIVGAALGALTGLGRWSRGVMGMTDTTQTTSTFGRDDVAKKVITYAGIGIIGVAALVLLVGGVAYYLTPEADRSPDDLRSIAMTVFNTLVPMFGTWVGTVIAFYFARENYEAAAKATKDLVGQLGDDRLKQILVKDSWIAVNAIAAVEVDDGQESTIDFKTKVEALLDSNKVTRVPVWNAGKLVRYVIHESMVYKFLAKNTKANLTLQDFLDFAVGAGTMKDVVSKIAWVAQTSTLADAKAKMEGKPDCQDVFVTNTGSDKEPVLGWITNADIAKKSKA